MTPNHDFLDNLANDNHQKMLREIANDDLTRKNGILSKKPNSLKMKQIQNHSMSEK